MESSPIASFAIQSYRIFMIKETLIRVDASSLVYDPFAKSNNSRLIGLSGVYDEG